MVVAAPFAGHSYAPYLSGIDTNVIGDPPGGEYAS